MVVRHRDVVLAHLEELGLRLNVRKVCFSSTENLLSGRGVVSDHDAGTYVPCSDRVNPHVSQDSKRRPVTHCQAVSKTAGSDVSCIQCDTFWPAVHETPTVVAQRGKPTSHDQGHAAMPTCLRHVEETLVFCLKGSGQEVDSLRLVRYRTVPSGYLCLIQLCWGWMLWYRLGRGFVCTPFPDHSLNEETVRPEVETQGAETASLIQLTARLVQCWDSCRPFLCRVSPLHPEVYVAAIGAYHTPLGDLSVGKTL